MMKFLFDIFPVIFFFIAYNRAEKYPEGSKELANQFLSHFTSGDGISLQMAPILLATALTIFASVLQIGYLLLRRKKIDVMLWVAFSIVTVFGGLTIYFQNDTFIKVKVTILYGCFAFSFLFGQYVLKKNLLKSLMGKEIQMPDVVWAKLSLIWAGCFIFMGGLNLYVAFNYTQSQWVSYKLYSHFALSVFLVIVLSFFLAKYIEDPDDSTI